MSDDPVKQRLLERMQAYQEGQRDAVPATLALRARLGRTLDALIEIRRYALTVAGAFEAYGESKSAHLWQEVADLADTGLE